MIGGGSDSVGCIKSSSLCTCCIIWGHANVFDTERVDGSSMFAFCATGSCRSLWGVKLTEGMYMLERRAKSGCSRKPFWWVLAAFAKVGIIVIGVNDFKSCTAAGSCMHPPTCCVCAGHATSLCGARIEPLLDKMGHPKIISNA